ncbi:MAG TPA: acylphosphatase [Firmicutes bacterium]|nr:acylphosphatase [Bacillota bacterium]
MTEAGKKIRVTGHVQGVGFRYYCLRHARRLGIRGSVKNHSDGSVIVEAWALPDDLDAFIPLVCKGPAFASVKECVVEKLTGDPGAQSFEVKY